MSKHVLIHTAVFSLFYSIAFNGFWMSVSEHMHPIFYCQHYSFLIFWFFINIHGKWVKSFMMNYTIEVTIRKLYKKTFSTSPQTRVFQFLNYLVFWKWKQSNIKHHPLILVFFMTNRIISGLSVTCRPCSLARVQLKKIMDKVLPLQQVSPHAVGSRCGGWVQAINVKTPFLLQWL